MTHCRYFDTTRKGNHSATLIPTVVGGRRPLPLKSALKVTFQTNIDFFVNQHALGYKFNTRQLRDRDPGCSSDSSSHHSPAPAAPPVHDALTFPDLVNRTSEFPNTCKNRGRETVTVAGRCDGMSGNTSVWQNDQPTSIMVECHPNETDLGHPDTPMDTRGPPIMA